MDRYFGETGLLPKAFRGYETRGEQSLMADAVAKALEKGRHLIVEAGTGVGKSLAYLIPLISHVLSEEGRRAVVSTYTKALQRQLVEKELPFLKEHVFKDLRFAFCLGSENYVCLRRVEKAKTYGLFDADETEEINSLFRWLKKTVTGIRADSEVSQRLWRKVCRESDLCYGRGCRSFDHCFYQRAKQIERKAHILVTNHHLFFANVLSGWKVIPSFDTAVFDEAHVLEDVASDYLGVEFSNLRLRNFLDSVLSPHGRGLLLRLSWLNKVAFSGVNDILNVARSRGEVFFSALARKMGEATAVRIREKGFVENDLTQALLDITSALKVIGESAGEEDEKEIAALAMRSEALGLSLKLIIDHELENHVYWAEKEGRRLRLVATPVDMASILKTQVFDVLAPAIATSATLSVNDSFDYIKERLGLPNATTLLLRSPFDYRNQVTLYVPGHISEPGAEGFEDDIIGQVKEILRVTMGRTLVLFTSYALLEKAHNDIRIPGLKILRQGDSESYRLVREFRKESNSALFGTYTFWQGIDIPGDDLRCVVITKLPFSVPDEPVIEARTEALAGKGGNPFYQYHVPRAVILLKQGFGRLIRTKTDSGAVAILDPRIKTRRYGRQFLSSLPGCSTAASVDDIGRFVRDSG